MFDPLENQETTTQIFELAETVALVDRASVVPVPVAFVLPISTGLEIAT